MDLDTWVNIILAICVIIILYIARQNEQRHERRKKAAKGDTSDSAAAVAEPSTSSTPAVEPIVTPRADSRKFSLASRHSKDTLIPEDVAKMHKRGEREGEKAKTYSIGQKIVVPVEGIHFTTHRCKVRGTNPTMSAMMKYTADQFKAMEVFCARWHFGDFSCWAVDGVDSNRILYVLKKRGIETVEVTVVAPPEITGDDYPETQGMDYQKIQLIP